MAITLFTQACLTTATPSGLALPSAREEDAEFWPMGRRVRCLRIDERRR
jgi:hypothetical protein